VTWHLTTDRLELRPMRDADVAALAQVLGDPWSMRFYPAPFDLDATTAWVRRNQERYEQDGFGLLAVVDRATDEVIGDCGPTLQEVDGEHHVELGWHIRRDRQRQGFATEAGRACRDQAFEVLHPERLISPIRPENVPSWSVARALGFTPWRPTVRVGMAHVVWSFSPNG
jgi:[ribosomal protein S5]-alanine N-acetyltransferase